MLPRVGAGEVLPKSPLRSPERRNRATFDGQSSSERGIEGGSSPRTGASRPWIGYPARAKMAKKEILAQVSRETPDHGE